MLCAAAAVCAARELTFEERVQAQEALARVSYRHQIGATRPFEEAFPRSLLEERVRHALGKDPGALTSEMLEREVLRMRAGTRFPERLRELFAALHDDPLLIRECLARATLVERLQQDLPTRATQATCAFDVWQSLGAGGAPEPRAFHSAVWTGNLMLVWGGLGGGAYLQSGGRYDPATDSWFPTSLVGAPSGRAFHGAVWSGSRMLVWGGVGYEGGYAYLDSGGSYDPASDTWSALPFAGAPSGRAFHSALWTGSAMLVWGGFDEQAALASGGRYDPATNSWTALSDALAPSARGGHSAVWTGSEMLVWGGGSDGSPYLETGGGYDPETDTWRVLSSVSAPSPRDQQSAVWTGSEMLVWGGLGDGHLNSGGRYDPLTDTWRPISSVLAPAARASHSAVWTGHEMVIWGGEGDEPPYAQDSGGRYDPLRDTWTETTTLAAPAGRASHSAVWTGRAMVVFGGTSGASEMASGGSYLLVASDADDADGDGFSECQGDCDDSEPRARPGAVERCDGIDDDCDGAIDEGGDALCADGRACTADSCHAASGCAHVPLPLAACDDGDPCTTNDACSALGRCVGGAPSDCDDRDPCTLDRCAPGAGCEHTPSSCTRIDFAPPGSAVPPGFAKDDGSVFAAARGFGWSASVGTRARNSANPPELDTFAFSQAERRWTQELANGDYEACVEAGDPLYSQGPQRIRAQGVPLIDGLTTEPNEFASACTRIPVRGGRLELTLGGTSGNTLLNVLTSALTASSVPLRSISFAPPAATPAPGFAKDAGEVFDAARGYGWDAPLPSRERNRALPQVLDTFVFSSAPRTWELSLPDGSYDVWYGLGDADYAEGPHHLLVEGALAVHVATPAGVFIEGRTQAQVHDGRLSIQIGDGTSAVTTLDYIVVAARDSDADGVADLDDDCPLAADPGQEDADGDGIGLACDDCPFDFDPAQPDADQDGIGDACDRDDGEILVLSASRDVIAWGPELGQSSWNVYVGDLDVLRDSGVYTQPASTSPLARQLCGLEQPWFEDRELPPSGKATFSLVTGYEDGVEGSLGRDSRGVERPNTLPCP